MLAVHELFLNHRHRTLQPWFTNGWRRKAVAVIIAIFCAAPFVGADEEEECEEGDEGCEPEFELTICAYLDAACSEPAGECLVRTDEDNSDCSTAEAEDEDEDGEPDSDELINTSPFGESEGYMRMNCDTVVKVSPRLHPLRATQVNMCCFAGADDNQLFRQSELFLQCPTVA
jgi:hypothetical protein